MKIHWTIAALACVLLFDQCNACAQGSPWGISIERKVTGTPKAGVAGLNLEFVAKITMEADALGRLSGKGVHTMTYKDDEGHLFEGNLDFDCTGSFTGKTVNVSAAKMIVMYSKNPKSHGKSIPNPEKEGLGKTTTTLPPEMHVYKGTLALDPASTDGLDVFKEVTTFENAVTAFKVATIIRGYLPALRVAITAKRPLIPGHLRYFNELTVTVTGPSAPPAGVTVLVNLEAGDKGRLSEDQGWAGTPTLKLTGVKLGQSRKIYYAWAAAPPTAIHRAKVTAMVEGTPQAKGSTNFEVGVNYEVVRASQLVGQSITTGKRTLIGVYVRDSLHPDKDPGALASELDIRPVLGMKQTGFIPLADLGQFVNGLSLNAAGLIEYALAAAHDGAAHSIGNGIDWDVSPGGLLTGHGDTDEGKPTILFQDRGVFVFEFDVTALAYAEGRMPEPESPKHVARFHTTQLDPNSAFFFETLVPCIQGVVGALKDDPLAQTQALWECLHGALSSELAQNAIGHNVVANTIGGLIAQAIDASFQIAGHEPTTAAEQVGDQTLDMIQATLKSTPGTYVTLVEKSGTTRFDTTSSTAGALQPGPTKLDLRAIRPTNEAERTRAAEVYAPNRRIQEGKRFAVVAAGEKETLTLDLGGERGRGEIVVVSSHGVVRAAYPAGPWASRVEVRPDGTMRVVSGTALNIERRATKPANAAPAVPTPAPIDLRRSQPARNERLGS